MTAQQNPVDEHFCPCPAGRHWGPRGAAGILPYAVARDGQAWVLLSHRSLHVQRGGTWSTFGGAIDAGESAWQAAVRETSEEIRGIAPDQASIACEFLWECPQGCGWTYTTFAVRVPLHPGGSLPRARVARGRAAWETAGLAWVPASQVQDAGRDLHPSFADAWPTLREAISGPLMRQAAELCRDAGADPELIPGWIEEGRRRRANAVRPPFGAPRRIRPGQHPPGRGG